MIVVPSKRAVVLNVDNTAAIKQVVPTAIPVWREGRELLVIPHRLDETKVLRNLGIRVPSPIVYHYDWPIRTGWKPFEHQIETAAFATLHRRAFILNDMGTGKTLSILWAFDYLRSKGLVSKLLISAPLSTLERVWADEVFMHFPHLETVVLHGTPERRRKLLSQAADVYIINHDGLKMLQVDLMERDDIDCVDVDESAVFRNHKTDLWKALKRVLIGRKYVWFNTGSPTPNKPTDAWAQVRLLCPDNVPAYFTKFQDQTMRKMGAFRWVEREDALQVVSDAMRPAIRYKREDCIDLPPVTVSTREVPLSSEQAKAYKEMAAKLRMEYAGGLVTAVNESVKAMKLVQIACIAYGTEVLTKGGWTPIQNVSEVDLVWDGEEWVSQKGAAYMGFKPVVELDGVRMTADHRVWVGSWKTAGEVLDADASCEFVRPAIRIPAGYPPGRFVVGQDAGRPVEMSLRLRSRRGAVEPIPSEQAAHAPQKLRMPPRQRSAQDDPYPTIRRVGEDEKPVPAPFGQRLEELRRAGHHGLRAVASFVLGVLRRHAPSLPPGHDLGQGEQRSGVLSPELPVGNTRATKQQQTHERTSGHAERAPDSGSSSASVWAETWDAWRQADSVQLATDAGADRVYDLINCGPRARFVVRGRAGDLLLVHNCGVAYDVSGDNVLIPCEPRIAVINEIIEEAEGKVIVFVPLTGGLHMVAEQIAAKGVAVEWVNGETPKTVRDDIFLRFQKSKEPRVLVAHPKCMAHGLSFTAASVIVWYIPTNDNEVYEQACDRIPRPGQKRHMHIIHLAGTPVERKMYKRLEHKGARQGTLLDLIEEDEDR